MGSNKKIFDHVQKIVLTFLDGDTVELNEITKCKVKLSGKHKSFYIIDGLFDECLYEKCMDEIGVKNIVITALCVSLDDHLMPKDFSFDFNTEGYITTMSIDVSICSTMDFVISSIKTE